MSNHAENDKLWKTWRKTKTDGLNYLLDILFEKWNMNKENEFRGYNPDDLRFRDYHSAIGITSKWEKKEAYSFSLNSHLWFNGRVYNDNEDDDLYIKNYTKKIANNGVYSIYEDIIVCDNVFE